MGSGRWGGRASPHMGRDVGPAAQGETLGTPAFTSTPKSGAINRETEGEKLQGFKPKEGGSLNNQTKGEKRSTESKPPGKTGANDREPTGMATDPLTEKGSKIMKNMEEQYGPEKGKSVFYASKNKGTIKGVDARKMPAPATRLRG